jgi:hypothetical protein
MQITRANIDELLDAGALQFNGGPYGWLVMRRDGPTERTRRSIYLNYEVGECFQVFGAIGDYDFDVNGGALSSYWYRVRLQ